MWMLILIVVGTREVTITKATEFYTIQNCQSAGDKFKEEMKKISDKLLPRYVCVEK